MKQIITYCLYLFIFLLPFQTRWIYQPTFLNGGYFEYGTFSLYATEILLGIIIILSICHLIIKFKNSVKLTKQSANRLLLPILLFLLVLLNCFSALNKDLAFFKLTWLILGVALFCIILTIRPDFKKISWSFIASALIQSGFALTQFIQQKVFANKWLGIAGQDPQTLGTPVVETGTRWLRTFGALPHPNMLAGFLVISLFLIIGLYFLAKNKKKQLCLSVIFAVNFFALVTAMSRAAILTFLLILILMAIFCRKNIWQIKIIANFALIAVLIFTLFAICYPGLISSRTFGDSRVENISNATRVAQYQEFWQIYKNNWIIGTGLGNYPQALAQLKPEQPAYIYQPIHNTYLLIIGELGLLGIIFIVLLTFCFVKCLFSNIPPSPCPLPAVKGDESSLACLRVAELRFGEGMAADRFREPLKKFRGSLNLIFLNSRFGFARLALFAYFACLALFDHFLWSFYFGIMLTAIVFAIALLKDENLLD